ncbi:LTA synthase family protein [Paenibacillus contaminans]|uniref:LTA synthase family protein n=1 Tax=Paenibacillus contaminans TaxID=450362 RepID=A0A329MJ90_9BACL|nr:LTA synthase family protein [Paenibacillus contaminans]RAV19885.1 LTA synthase family protein [Paenibacillus contaminans]
MNLIEKLRTFGKKPFVLFSLILLLKSYLAWLVVFDSKVSFMPLLTEIPFAWLLFSLIEWFASKRKLGYYLSVNLLLTAVFFAVIMYYKYYGVIVTYHALQQVNQVTAVSNSVFSLMDPYFLFIFIDILVFGYVLLRKKKATTWKSTVATRTQKKGLVSAMFVVSLVLCLMNVLPNRASMNEIVKAGEMGILNYEAYTIFSSKKQELVDSKEITQESVDELKGIRKQTDPSYWKAAEGKNIIVIQLESFQNFLIGLKIDGQEITPNMNRLAKENFYFPNFYQQVGQGNTSDAEFVVNTSFYIPPIGAATQTYADRSLVSMPKLLKQNGYNSATFHTNVVEFWNRGELYKALGFDHYYDQSFFGQEDTVFFGPSDEMLYAKTADEIEKMSKSGQPFYTQIISMTAHHPFTIPDKKYHMTLPKRYEGTFVGDYIRAQNYADYALGQFIDSLKQKGIWDNSLIVLYGDHLGLPIYSLDRDDKDLMEEIYGREYGYSDMINIPLIMVSPGLTQPQTFDQIGGQVDILPTVANLLGVSMNNQLHFGQDLLNQTYNLLPQRYYLPTGSFMSDKALFLPGRGFEDGTNYPVAGNIGDGAEATEEEYERALKLLHMSDSYILQLPAKE